MSHGFSWFNWPSAADPTIGFAFTIANFVVLLLVLEKLMFRKLRAGHKARYEALRAQLDEATSARASAEALLRDVEKRLSGLDAELEEIRAHEARAAAHEREEIVAKAKAEAARIVATAQASAERLAQARRAELERELVRRAVAEAEAIIRQNFGADDDRRVVSEFVDDLGRVSFDHQSPRLRAREGAAPSP